MAAMLSRLTVGACIALAIGAWMPTRASAITLSYGYSGTGNASFQSDTTLGVGGSCIAACVISAVMTISGTGPAFNATTPSGWGAGASGTITDNLGNSILLAVNTGNFPGTNREMFGGFFMASVLPSTLDVSTSSFALFLGGSGTVNYSISISLPDGAHFTPLPAALPLFATGLGAIGLLGWRRRRKAEALAA